MTREGLSDRNRQILAVFSGIFLLGLLLLVIWLDEQFDAEPPQLITLQEVQIYTPPPPPPPPPVNQNTTQSARPSMSIQTADNRIELELMDLDVGIEAGSIGDFGTGDGGLGEGLGTGDWGTFEFADLDGTPMVISAPLFGYPQELIDQNVLEIHVMLHIMVDQEGNNHPVRVVENSYPETNTEIMEYASKVRFTPPTRLGLAVNAEYLWPLVLRYNRGNQE